MFISIEDGQVGISKKIGAKKARIRSKVEVPLYGKWIFSLKIVTLNSGISVGLIRGKG